MFRIAKNAMAAIALTGLVLSQPAMAVRSSESLPAPGAKVLALGNRAGTPIKKSEDFVGVPIIAIVIAGAVVLATILIIAKDKHGNKSPG
jgi:hypothetical protein